MHDGDGAGKRSRSASTIAAAGPRRGELLRKRDRVIGHGRWVQQVNLTIGDWRSGKNGR